LSERRFFANRARTQVSAEHGDGSSDTAAMLDSSFKVPSYEMISDYDRPDLFMLWGL
jgi:hypothetical protein